MLPGVVGLGGGAVARLLGLLLALVLHGFPWPHGAGLLGRLLAALEGLFARLARLVLDLVREIGPIFSFSTRVESGRERASRPTPDRAERQAQRVS